MCDYTVILPTLNAASYLPILIEKLRQQSISPKEIIIIDSSSEDNTAEIASRLDGVRFVCISRSEFDHGGTRNMGVSISQTPMFVMMSQDALPANEQCMEHLLGMLEEPGVSAVTARQVARPEAPAYEKEVRAWRYPDKTRIWNQHSLSELGLRAFLLSDVCAAYRRDAFDSVGGYTAPVPCNEDMLIAADFLSHGYSLAYCSEALVLHSHHYSFKQEFRRNMLIGRFLDTYSDRFAGCSDMSEGFAMLRTVTGKLMNKREFADIFPFWLNCTARYLGNRMGRLKSRKASS